jgi:hypothetical protein
LDVDVLSQERQRYGQREREWEWDRDWEWDREWELVTSMEEIVEPVTVVFDPGNVFKFVVTVDSHWLSLLIIYIVPSGLHQQRAYSFWLRVQPCFPTYNIYHY